MKGFEPGNMNHRITLHTVQHGTDGFATKTRSSIATVWAQIEHMKGDEVNIDAARQVNIYEVTIRTREDFKSTTNEISWDGDYYSITSMTHDRLSCLTEIKMVATND